MLKIGALCLLMLVAAVYGRFSIFNSTDSKRDFLRFVNELDSRPISDLVATKDGRSYLRRFSSVIKTMYQSALKALGYNLHQLKHTIRDSWMRAIRNYFQDKSISSSVEAKDLREKIKGYLPFPVKTRPSSFPEDPYVDDPMFYERVFRLTVSWRSFYYSDNKNLTLLYERYKKLWMRTYANNTLLSEAAAMSLKVTLERLVSIATELELHGIKSDEDDFWQSNIPSDVISKEVQDSFTNDNFYVKRMFQHDHSNSGLLFYGLPIGLRLPTVISTPKVSLAQAQKELAETVAKKNDDCTTCEQVMDHLAKVGNQYLMAISEEKDNCLNPLTCSRSNKKKSVATKVLECAASLTLETDENPNSFLEVYDFGDAVFTRNMFNELVYDCLNDGSNLSLHEKHENCVKKVSNRAMHCAWKILHDVSDPSILVRKGSIRVNENTIMTLQCDKNEVLRISDLQVYVQKRLVEYPKTGLLVPPIAYYLHRDDISEKSLEIMENECNGRQNCSVYTNVEKMSGHTSLYNLVFNVEYECLQNVYNPDLNEVRKQSAHETEELSLQCRNDHEVLRILDAKWKKEGGARKFLNNAFIGPLLAFMWNENDMNDKALRLIKTKCEGLNKCRETVDLEKISGHTSWYSVHLDVKYECVPCDQSSIDVLCFLINKKLFSI